MADQNTYLHGIEILEIDTGGQTITTPSTSIIGIVGTAPSANASNFPLNTPVLITRIQDINTLEMGEIGTIPMALRGIYNQASPVCVVVRIEDGEQQEDTIKNAAGDEATYTGVYALSRAEGAAGVNVKPKILICPYLSSITLEDGSPNAIVTNLIAVAGKLRAVAVIDGPSTTKSAAVSFASKISSARAYIVDPSYKPSFESPSPNPATLSSSPLAAGVIAKTDAEYGFWYSPSNKELKGIVELSRPIDFNYADPSTEANALNEAGVATIVYTQSSFRLWGNKTPATDSKWQFLSVRRTVDTVYDAIESSMLWAMDKPFSKQLLSDIQNNVQTYINGLIAQGALLGGTAVIDQNENTIETYTKGQLIVTFDLEPPVPVDRLTFKAYRNSNYAEQLFS